MKSTSMSKKETIPAEGTASSGNGAIAKIVTLVIIACGAGSLGLAVHSYHVSPYAPGTIRFALVNWSTVFIIFEAALAYTLKRLQGGAYWFFWLQIKNPSLDERQRQVRQMVFERAYAYALVFLLLSAIYVLSYAPPEHIARLSSRHDFIIRTVWTMGIFLVCLPSMLAAWRKDS